MPAPALPLAAEPGWSLGDPWTLALAFAGIAVLAAVAALSHQHERAFSASAVYLLLGGLGAVLLGLGDQRWIDPIEDATLLERATELTIVFALFATGLRLDRPFGGRAWSSVRRLLGIGMPVGIALTALFGWGVMGLSAAAALALGAMLAPTDPVLAGDIGVGPPGEEEEREPEFSVTGEAGLNDGLAYPFILLAFVIAEGGSVLSWALADVAYALVTGTALGALAGRLLAASVVRLSERKLLAGGLEGFLAVAAVLLVYGATESIGAYGFVAVFTAGLAFRRYERDHQVHAEVHDRSEVIEKFLELAIILLVGSLLAPALFRDPGLAGWLLVPLALLVIRPFSVVVALTGLRLERGERRYIGWFGVRGVATVYYAAVIAGSGAFSEEETRVLVWTGLAVVAVSIVAHGVTASPLRRRWTPPATR